MIKTLRTVRNDSGFTMAAVMIGMLTVMSLSVAAFAAANGDIRLGQRSVDEKKAFAAAEAGTAYYLQKLSQDNDYWTKCTTDSDVPAAQNPVNQMWTPVAGVADPRVWKSLPTAVGQQYAIELLPRAGRSACTPNQNDSMIDPRLGTLRIRSTGRSNGVYRSVVSTLRRNGFLDFIYFTSFETSDPAQQVLAQPRLNRAGKTDLWREVGLKRLTPAEARADTTNSADSIEAWADQPGNPGTGAKATCAQWLRPSSPTQRGRAVDGFYGAADGRGSAQFDPDGVDPLDWYRTDYYGAGNNIQCSRIQFRGPDKVDGPFHSNDHICVVNNPSFGRAGKEDRIEYYGLHPSCDNSATFNSTPKTGTDLATIGVPKSNAALRQTTSAPYVFTGRTEITLKDDRLEVKRAGSATVESLSMPANGLVYVENDPGVVCPKFDIRRPYPTDITADRGCGDAEVKGTYAKSLTIAAQRDVVIAADVTAKNGSDALLGLIGENYVRVKHTMAAQPCDAGTPDAPAPPQNRRIEAAILSLSHVFTLDNYQCGDPLGTLTVFGAIAQLYRGPVGTSSGGSAVTGYTKNYEYDDRLQFRSPPFFITPVEASWRVMRSSEQSPATRPR